MEDFTGIVGQIFISVMVLGMAYCLILGCIALTRLTLG